jgi:hypothetical protein
MPCWKRSNAKAKTRPRLMKSSAWRGNTNLSLPTRRFSPYPALCCGPASFVPEIPCCGSRPTNPSRRSPRCFRLAWCRSYVISPERTCGKRDFLHPTTCRTEPTPCAWSYAIAKVTPIVNSRPSSLPASRPWFRSNSTPNVITAARR